MTGLTLGATVILYARTPEALEVARSPEGLMGSAVTVIVNAKVPARVGIPEMLPVSGLSTNAGGNSP